MLSNMDSVEHGLDNTVEFVPTKEVLDEVWAVLHKEQPNLVFDALEEANVVEDFNEMLSSAAISKSTDDASSVIGIALYAFRELARKEIECYEDEFFTILGETQDED